MNSIRSDNLFYVLQFGISLYGLKINLDEMNQIICFRGFYICIIREILYFKEECDVGNGGTQR